MPKSGLNVALKGLDDLFSSEETRQEEQREQVQQMLDNKISHSHSPAVPPDFFSTDATALKMVAILFDNGLITADTYHQVISRYST